MKLKVRIAFLILFFAHLFVRAEIKLPALILDHMVLQRDAKIPVWGWARPGEKVMVTFKDEVVSTTTYNDGKWLIKLASSAAGGPYEMKISGEHNVITIHDILIGDVFLCSGQSNMEYGINKDLYPVEIQQSLNPQIRQFKINRNSADMVLNDIALHSDWISASPNTLNTYSAVGYFFASSLYQKYHVPIGIINSSYGSSLAEAWISKEGLAGFPEFFSQSRVATAQSNPMVLFNAMLYPLTNYAIKGVLWYQGEFNANRAFQYRKLLPALINDWRKHFAKKDLPFVIIQLPNYNKILPQPAQSAIAELREAQALTSELKNTALVTTIDINSDGDLHPKEKKPIGERSALAVQQLIYHEHIQAYGPQYKSFSIHEAKIIIRLKASSSPVKPVDSITNFTIAGADQKFFQAKAILKNNTIEVSSPNVSNPAAVRYCWADNPQGVNLYNLAGLPATPFRTDDWPGFTVPKTRIKN